MPNDLDPVRGLLQKHPIETIMWNRDDPQDLDRGAGELGADRPPAKKNSAMTAPPAVRVPALVVLSAALSPMGAP
jgi:hypothetical protein